MEILYENRCIKAPVYENIVNNSHEFESSNIFEGCLISIGKSKFALNVKNRKSEEFNCNVIAMATCCDGKHCAVVQDSQIILLSDQKVYYIPLKINISAENKCLKSCMTKIRGNKFVMSCIFREYVVVLSFNFIELLCYSKTAIDLELFDYIQFASIFRDDYGILCCFGPNVAIEDESTIVWIVYGGNSTELNALLYVESEIENAATMVRSGQITLQQRLVDTAHSTWISTISRDIGCYYRKDSDSTNANDYYLLAFTADYDGNVVIWESSRESLSDGRKTTLLDKVAMYEKYCSVAISVMVIDYAPAFVSAVFQPMIWSVDACGYVLGSRYESKTKNLHRHHSLYCNGFENIVDLFVLNRIDDNSTSESDISDSINESVVIPSDEVTEEGKQVVEKDDGKRGASMISEVSILSSEGVVGTINVNSWISYVVQTRLPESVHENSCRISTECQIPYDFALRNMHNPIKVKLCAHFSNLHLIAIAAFDFSISIWSIGVGSYPRLLLMLDQSFDVSEITSLSAYENSRSFIHGKSESIDQRHNYVGVLWVGYANGRVDQYLIHPPVENSEPQELFNEEESTSTSILSDDKNFANSKVETYKRPFYWNPELVCTTTWVPPPNAKGKPPPGKRLSTVSNSSKGSSMKGSTSGKLGRSRENSDFSKQLKQKISKSASVSALDIVERGNNQKQANLSSDTSTKNDLSARSGLSTTPSLQEHDEVVVYKCELAWTSTFLPSRVTDMQTVLAGLLFEISYMVVNYCMEYIVVLDTNNKNTPIARIPLEINPRVNCVASIRVFDRGILPSFADGQYSCIKLPFGENSLYNDQADRLKRLHLSKSRKVVKCLFENGNVFEKSLQDSSVSVSAMLEPSTHQSGDLLLVIVSELAVKILECHSARVLYEYNINNTKIMDLPSVNSVSASVVWRVSASSGEQVVENVSSSSDFSVGSGELSGVSISSVGDEILMIYVTVRGLLFFNNISTSNEMFLYDLFTSAREDESLVLDSVVRGMTAFEDSSISPFLIVWTSYSLYIVRLKMTRITTESGLQSSVSVVKVIRIVVTDGPALALPTTDTRNLPHISALLRSPGKNASIVHACPMKSPSFTYHEVIGVRAHRVLVTLSDGSMYNLQC